MIHRDIKPGNIWLEPTDQFAEPATTAPFRVKILDFGLARPVSEVDHLTAHGALVGTPSYMAPEQAAGETLDGRCDLFSLGVLLYKLCSGNLPFQGRDVIAVLSALASKAPESLSAVRPDIPPKLHQLIDRLLAKDPNDRPASAQRVATEIHAILHEIGSGSQSTVPVAPTANPRCAIETQASGFDPNAATVAASRPTISAQAPRKRQRLWIMTAFFGLLLAIGSVVIVVKGRDGKRTQVEIPESSKATEKPDGTAIGELTTVPDPKVANGVRNPDRKAAAALNPYVNLTLTLASGKEEVVKKGEALPAEEFTLKGLGFVDFLPEKFTEEIFLPAVAELRCLEVIAIWAHNLYPVSEEQIVQLAGLPLAKTLKELSAPFELTPGVLDGLKRFPKLDFLVCPATNVDDATLLRLSELKNLTRLGLGSLGRSGAISEQGREAIARLPVSALLLTDSPIVNRAFLQLLPKMSKLNHVNFYLARLDTDDIPLIASAPKLEIADLVDTGISDAGLAHLAKADKLWQVNVEKNPGVTDAGLDSLAKLPKLKHVLLRGTKVTAAGIDRLKKSLPRCRIEWDGGEIQPVVSPDRKAASALNPYLDLALTLASGKEAIVKKGEALPAEEFTLKCIWAHAKDAVPEKFTEEILLPAVAELRYLVIMDMIPLTDEQIVQLAGMPLANTLQILSAQFELTPRILEGLKRFPKLAYLHCGATNVDDATLLQLCELKNLLHLGLERLGRSGKISAQGREAVARIPVTGLILTDSPIVDRAFLQLLPKMSKLEQVNFSGCPLETDDIPFLAAAPKLQAAALSATGISDAGLAHLAKAAKLWLVHVDANPGVTDAGLDSLAKMPELKKVSLRGTKATIAGIDRLKKALPQCRIEWDGGVIEPGVSPDAK